MPLYEYECRACARRIEKIQKFSDPELTVCPHCGGALERTLTAPAVQFKGSGWYKDLYSSAKPAAASGDKSAGDTTSKPSEAASASPSSSGNGSSPAAASAPAAAAATKS